MSSRAGELDFGANAAIGYDELVLDFHDHYIRGIANRFATDPPVRYFVMGANEWRDARTWPPPASRVEALYFHAVGDGGPGRLGAAPAAGLVSRTVFKADPQDPVTDPHAGPGAHDYRALEARDDVLTFDSEPLTKDLWIAGDVTAEIHASCNCRDFDLWVRLQAVHPDGRALNLMSPGNDVVRASYRDPVAVPQPLQPGRVYELRLETLMTATRFGEGHRIRVQISASFDPHLSRNLQTGESEVVSAESRAAEIAIHHDAGNASRLLLPVAN
jgi:putative CocE/NonD family hydrolase